MAKNTRKFRIGIALHGKDYPAGSDVPIGGPSGVEIAFARELETLHGVHPEAGGEIADDKRAAKSKPATSAPDLLNAGANGAGGGEDGSDDTGGGAGEDA